MTDTNSFEEFLNRYGLAGGENTNIESVPYSVLERYLNSWGQGGTFSWAPEPGSPEHHSLELIASYVAVAWMESPKYRVRATFQQIRDSLRGDLPDDFLRAGYGLALRGILILWCEWGWAERTWTNPTRGLKHSGLSRSKRQDWVLQIDTETMALGVIHARYPALGEAGGFHGWSRAEVVAATGVSSRCVEVLFRSLRGSADYTERVVRQGGKTARVLQYVGDGNA